MYTGPMGVGGIADPTQLPWLVGGIALALFMLGVLVGLLCRCRTK